MCILREERFRGGGHLSRCIVESSACHGLRRFLLTVTFLIVTLLRANSPGRQDLCGCPVIDLNLDSGEAATDIKSGALWASLTEARERRGP